MVTIADIDAYQAGTGGADFTLPIVNAARNAVCGIFQQYPGALIPGPVDDFVNGVYSGLCKNSTSGLPPAPTAPFTGGQCTFRYSVHLTYTFGYAGGTAGGDDTQVVYGPITSITPSNETDSLGDCLCWKIQAFDYTGAPTIFTSARGGGGPYAISGFNIAGITPVDGQPDTCGNPPPAYPPSSIPSGGTSIATTVPIPGGGTFGAITSLILPALAIAAFPELELAPLLAGILPSVGITVDLGGITINPSSSNGANISDINAALSKFGNNVINTPPPPPNSGTHNISTPGTPGSGGGKTGQSNLDYVLISLTTIPTSARVQYGNGGSPNVLIGAGWIEFTGSGNAFPRESINFQTAYFKAPDGSDGYQYSLSSGFAGTDVSYSRKQTS